MTSIAMGNFHVTPPPQVQDGPSAVAPTVQVNAASGKSAGDGAAAHQHQSGTGNNAAMPALVKKARDRASDASPNSIVEALARDKEKRAVSGPDQARDAARKAYSEKVDNPLDVREKLPEIDPPNPLPTAPILLRD